MKVGPLLAHIVEVRTPARRRVPRAQPTRHRDDHDVYHQCLTFSEHSGQAQAEARAR
jgi:hypothetical protein